MLLTCLAAVTLSAGPQYQFEILSTPESGQAQSVGITAGIGPANTVYTATVKTDPDPNAPKGNLYVEGTFQATTNGHPQVHCNYDGTFTARLYRGEVD